MPRFIPRVSPDVQARIDEAMCPECGEPVFLRALLRPDPNSCRADPDVSCRNMAHWTGKLSACRFPEKPDNPLAGLLHL